jgi:hypothetical protein
MFGSLPALMLVLSQANIAKVAAAAGVLISGFFGSKVEVILD